MKGSRLHTLVLMQNNHIPKKIYLPANVYTLRPRTFYIDLFITHIEMVTTQAPLHYVFDSQLSSLPRWLYCASCFWPGSWQKQKPMLQFGLLFKRLLSRWQQKPKRWVGSFCVALRRCSMWQAALKSARRREGSPRVEKFAASKNSTNQV